MNVSLSALNALATHLEIVSKNNRSHGGHGWTYDEEIKLLRAAVEEITELRRATVRRLESHSQPVIANGVRTSACGLSRGETDWYVIDCPDDVSQPEGTRAEFLELLSALSSRTSAIIGKRLGVACLPDGDTRFYSPHNCRGTPDDMVTIPEADLPAWIAHAEKVLG